ncbi:MAG: YetF domain-containing protein [Ginsengibacter sp.]
MQTIYELFGQDQNLNALQMSLRAIVIFFIALILIRYTGMRVFGIKSAFDTCIIIMLGAVLTRAIVGASPFVPTVVASVALVTVHKIIAGISVNNQMISHLVKGTPYTLYKEGKLNDKNLRKCLLSYGDIMEEVRLKLNQNSLENIDEIFMERTGKISVIEKKM